MTSQDRGRMVTEADTGKLAELQLLEVLGKSPQGAGAELVLLMPV